MGNEELIHRQILDNNGTTEAQEKAAEKRKQELSDGLEAHDVMALDDYDDLLCESIGPDAWNNKVHEDSLLKAIMDKDWLEVGRVIGEPARKYMADAVISRGDA